jgi:transposase-like protein
MTSIYSEYGQRPIGSTDPNEYPARIVKTDGFERLFSHYTGLHGDELMEYLQHFQTRALEVHSQ